MSKIGQETAVANTEQAMFVIENTRHPTHSLQLCANLASTAGAWTLYSSNQPNALPPADGAAAVPDPEKWSLETITVTNPAGALGSFMLHLSASGAKRYMLRFVASATSVVSVFAHGKD